MNYKKIYFIATFIFAGISPSLQSAELVKSLVPNFLRYNQGSYILPYVHDNKKYVVLLVKAIFNGQALKKDDEVNYWLSWVEKKPANERAAILNHTISSEQHGIRPDLLDGETTSNPLQVALIIKDVNLIERLLKLGASPDGCSGKTIQAAITSPHDEQNQKILTALLSNGLDANQKYPELTFNKRGPQGREPVSVCDAPLLLIAIKNNNDALAGILIRKGALLDDDASYDGFDQYAIYNSGYNSGQPIPKNKNGIFINTTISLSDADKKLYAECLAPQKFEKLDEALPMMPPTLKKIIASY